MKVTDEMVERACSTDRHVPATWMRRALEAALTDVVEPSVAIALRIQALENKCQLLEGVANHNANLGSEMQAKLAKVREWADDHIDGYELAPILDGE